MTGRRTTWVGADPGGKGSFGIAILADGKEPECSSVDCADEAIAFVRNRLYEAPAGVGVDAPLWWSSGQSGDRHADQWLRKRYGLSGGAVQVAENCWDIFAARFHAKATPSDEHTRDAMVCAVAAKEGLEGRWTHDLSATRLAAEQDPNSYWLAPVHYYWPET